MKKELRWQGPSTGRLYIWRLNDHGRYYLLTPSEVVELLSSAVVP